MDRSFVIALSLQLFTTNIAVKIYLPFFSASYDVTFTCHEYRCDLSPVFTELIVDC